VRGVLIVYGRIRILLINMEEKRVSIYIKHI